MNTKSSEKILWYGQDKPLPQQHLLKAGNLNLIFENGALRYIKAGEIEIIRMIYAAVRDQNWDTIEPLILQQKIEKQSDGFSIFLKCEYKKDDIHFIADYTVTGKPDHTINFTMEGVCLSNFKKNRIGFCVLHPILECSGKTCYLTHSNGTTEQCHFPVLISPQQPFKDIKSMSWELTSGLNATLNFEGAVFETEDQRNWTDASYKTYCTPLEEPFPVSVKEGQVFKQTVELTISGIVEKNNHDNKQHRLFIDHNTLLPFPEIGIGQSSENHKLTEETIDKIKHLNFRHYRTDVKLFEANWESKLIKVFNDARQLNIPVFIALHIKDVKEESIRSFIKLIGRFKTAVHKILIFKGGEKTTPSETLDYLAPKLRNHFPDLKIGAGTDAYFAELNRTSVDPKHLDFINFSINPQVHAFDNTSLIETLEAQKEVIKSARFLYPELAIAVSPVTLKPRFNPNATSTSSQKLDNLLEQVDSRQSSLFAAGWTLSSISSLTSVGTEMITYYETVGNKGLLIPNTDESNHQHAHPYQVSDFPMILVFKTLLHFGPDAMVKLSQSSHPLVFSALVINNTKEECIVIANHQEKELIISIAVNHENWYLKQLDSYALSFKNWLDQFENTAPVSLVISNKTIEIVIKPLAIAFISSH